MKMFGRSTFPIIISGVFMFNTLVIRFWVLFGAVAVNAINGTSGNKDPKTVSCENAGRKSCPLVKKKNRMSVISFK